MLWFPIGKGNADEWRLDIVALLAVTGESFIAEHAQAITSSAFGLLPRIMPAPHALQPRRPSDAGQHWARGSQLWPPTAQSVIAVCTISVASSIIGYAAWWTPVMTGRRFSKRSEESAESSGDLIIRTREGAIFLVKCNDAVARELYLGNKECIYHVEGAWYRVCMTAAAILIMPSVILLGNCTFNMQALVGAAYMTLNIAYWAIGLLTPRLSWDLSQYEFRDITPSDARDAHRTSRFYDCSENEEAYEDRETRPSYPRTLWFAIRETRDAAWVQRSGSVPMTKAWSQWCGEAEREAQRGNRRWAAVTLKGELLLNSAGTQVVPA